MSPTDEDYRWMARALDLAVAGRGRVEPNPCVGCVLVKEGQVIAEGFHGRYGGPHAEAEALSNATDAGVDAHGSTAYVILEPCCHTDKQTPPCVPRLIAAGLRRVVVGIIDPNPQVAGRGVEMLRQAGVDVDVGVLQDRCRQLAAPFVKRVVHRRPYVTLKWAVSRDGRVAGRCGRPVRISNSASTAVVMKLRGMCDAVAVGRNTLVNDDPLLTARTTAPPRHPLRIVLANHLDFPPSRRLFGTPDAGPVVVYTHDHAGNAAAADALQSRGVEVVRLPHAQTARGTHRFRMDDALADLADRAVTHLLVEPGPTLAGAMISRNLADRALVIEGQVAVGEDGLAAPVCPWPAVAAVELDGDVLREFLNPQASTYAAAVPSPDIHLLTTRS